LITASVLLILATFEVFIYTVNRRNYERAEALLDDVRQWRLGESTSLDTKQTRIAYGAIKNPDAAIGPILEQSYTIYVSNILYSIALNYHGLWRLGVRPSGVRVNFRFRDDRLSNVNYLLYTAVVDSSGTTKQLSADVEMRENIQDEKNANFGVGFRKRGTPPIALQTDADSEDQLGALISPKATKQERNAAFNFDPSCAFRLGGCQAVCQLMPAVWRELLTRLDTKQLSILDEQVKNRSCFLQKQH
jgi:hypothetical protein